MAQRHRDLPRPADVPARPHDLELVLGLTFLIVGLMALVAVWMYWIAPALLS